MKMPKLSKPAIIIIIGIILLSIAIGYAIYTMTSNTITVNVAPQATLSLTVDQTSIVQGESITLTATASDGAVCSGVAVDFKEGATILATVDMNGAGVATYTFTPTTGSHTYVATAEHP